MSKIPMVLRPAEKTIRSKAMLGNETIFSTRKQSELSKTGSSTFPNVRPATCVSRNAGNLRLMRATCNQ